MMLKREREKLIGSEYLDVFDGDVDAGDDVEEGEKLIGSEYLDVFDGDVDDGDDVEEGEKLIGSESGELLS